MNKETKSLNEVETSLLDVIKTLFRWKKFIIGVCTIIGIGSIVISLLMKDYYRATAIISPSNPSLTNVDNLFNTSGGSAGEMSFFGGKNEVNQLMSIANSGEIVDHVVKKFNLYEHYKVDSVSLKSAYKVRLKFDKLFDVVKNEYDAIVISVEDKDRELSAAIVKTILVQVDQSYQNITKKQQAEILKTFESGRTEKQNELKIITDSLNQVRTRYGIYDVITQSELYSTILTNTETNLSAQEARLGVLLSSPGIPRDSISMLKADIAGNKKKLDNLLNPKSNSKLNFSKFKQGAELVRILELQQESATIDLNMINKKYTQYRASAASNTSSINVLQEPAVPKIKSRPRRSILVISAVFVGFILTVLGILIFDNYKSLDWKEIVHAS